MRKIVVVFCILMILTISFDIASASERIVDEDNIVNILIEHGYTKDTAMALPDSVQKEIVQTFIENPEKLYTTLLIEWIKKSFPELKKI